MSMMNSQFEFRELLLKIQDLLSDNDRQRLLFLFGDDVPRYLRDDPSLSGTLRVLQSLFDKAIINEQDCEYLIDALRRIRCFDAAQRLQEYQQRHENSQDTVSLSLTDILVHGHQEDKIVTNMSVNPICLELKPNVHANEPIITSLEMHQSMPIGEEETSQISLRRWLTDHLCRGSFSCREYFLLTLLFLAIITIPLSARPWQRFSHSSGKIPKETSPTSEFNITVDSDWSDMGITLLRGYGPGDISHHLIDPQGLFIDNTDTAYITDLNKHRVIQYRLSDGQFRIVAGGNGNGNRTDQLNYPNNAILDKDSNSLIICDGFNNRLMRWSLQTGQPEEIMNIEDIRCGDLFLDQHGFLYLTDIDRDEVRRFRIGERKGKSVAGGYGEGKGLNQLNSPMFFTMDHEGSIYVSDHRNHRIMKWLPGSEKGILVAGGVGAGNGLVHLNQPMGIVVDQWKTIYVADFYNNRIIRWFENTFRGDVIIGHAGPGNEANQLRGPMDLAFDRQGNLYVIDHYNNRLQKYLIKQK